MKRECYTCHEIKSLEEFVSRKDRKYGKGYQCKQCHVNKTNEWVKKNPEKRKQIANAYVHRNKDKYRAKLDALRAQVFQAYGPSCLCCGEQRPQFLTLEHINGDGAAHRKRITKIGSRGGKGSKAYHGGSGSNIVYADLRERGFPQEGYCLLCWNCHMATRYKRTCPHKEKADGSTSSL